MEAEARKIIKCDFCKESVDLRKPKKDEPPNEGIIANLNASQGTTKEYHFCDEACLRDFLNARKVREAQASSKVLGLQRIEFEWK